jgi:hypothetical protein
VSPARRRGRPAPPPKGPARRQRAGGRAVALVVAVVVLVGAPVLVVMLASAETVPAVHIAPGGAPLRPSAPFLANAGNGVRPDGIGCSAPGPRAVRGRAHLDVFADGARVTVPAGIGVLPTCAYWLHTARPDGVVAIDSPERRRFTLGNLFDIWGAPLERRRALSFALGAGRRLRAFVDGRRVAGDPRAIRLVPGREIALVVGRAPASVPARFGG